MGYYYLIGKSISFKVMTMIFLPDDDIEMGLNKPLLTNLTNTLIKSFTNICHFVLAVTFIVNLVTNGAIMKLIQGQS